MIKGVFSCLCFLSLLTLVSQASAQVLNAADFPGADIGEQIQSAYSALPSTGGIINVTVPPSGLEFSHSVEISAPGKPAIIECQSNPGSGGLKFLSNAGAAFTFDYGPGQTGVVGPRGAGMRNCFIYGNHGSSVGLMLGGSTNGAQGFYADNISVEGFGTGILFGNHTWATTVFHSRIAKSDVLLNIPMAGYVNMGEQVNFIETSFIGAGPDTFEGAVNVGGTGPVAYTVQASFIDCSFDNAQVVANVPTLNLTNAHFENPGSGLIAGAFLRVIHGYVNLSGTQMWQDGNGGCPTAKEMIKLEGGVTNITGLDSYSRYCNYPHLITMTGSSSLRLTHPTFLAGTAGPAEGVNLLDNQGTGSYLIETAVGRFISNTPIQNTATAHAAIYGISDSSYGLRGSSTSSHGVYASSASGMAGLFQVTGPIGADNNLAGFTVQRVTSATQYNINGALMQLEDKPSFSTGALRGPIFQANVGSVPRIVFNPNVSDGSKSAAYSFDTSHRLASPGALHTVWRNNGITTAAVDATGKGIFNGLLLWNLASKTTSHRCLQVNSVGTVSAAAGPCGTSGATQSGTRGQIAYFGRDGVLTGRDISTRDIPESPDRRYLTDAEQKIVAALAVSQASGTEATSRDQANARKAVMYAGNLLSQTATNMCGVACPGTGRTMNVAGYTLPAIPAGSCIVVKFWWHMEAATTAAKVFGWKLGSVGFSYAPISSDSTGLYSSGITLCNDPDTQIAQWIQSEPSTSPDGALRAPSDLVRGAEDLSRDGVELNFTMAADPSEVLVPHKFKIDGEVKHEGLN